VVPSEGPVGLGECSPWCRSIKQLAGNHADYSCINWKKEKLWRRLRLLISLLTQAWNGLQAKFTPRRAFLQHSCDYCNNKPRALILSLVKQGDATVCCMPMFHLCPRVMPGLFRAALMALGGSPGERAPFPAALRPLPLGWKHAKSHPSLLQVKSLSWC